MLDKTKSNNIIQIVYELNGPIKVSPEDRLRLKSAFIAWRANKPALAAQAASLCEKNLELKKFGEEFESNCGNPTNPLEFLRQLSVCSRAVIKEHIIIFIEAADFLLPAGDLNHLNEKHVHRIYTVHDWINDPAFINGQDTLVLIAESKSLIHPKISSMPHVLQVEANSPDLEARKHYINAYAKNVSTEDMNDLAKDTAGLSLYALRQLIRAFNGDGYIKSQVIEKTAEYIQNQLGEDMIEAQKTGHLLKDCIGYEKLKRFIINDIIPRFKQCDNPLCGITVAGPIGAGKTHIFNAMAAEIGASVFCIKNVRDQYYGNTDIKLERLKRLLYSLDKAILVIDEADTFFGGVGGDVHETERRLTGKFQVLMSDPALRGKIFWLLMTARIHMLSPDLRRNGRVGDLIVPVLDPMGQDRLDFIKWMLKDTIVKEEQSRDETVKYLDKILEQDYSSAAFDGLRRTLKNKKYENINELTVYIDDFIQPAIALTRRYQTLQAIKNCTRKSLIPDAFLNTSRKDIEVEIMHLEAQGIK